MGTSNRGPRLWDAAITRVSDANAAGSAIYPQLLPRPIGLLMGHELSTNPICACPTYLAMEDLPLAKRIDRLKNPSVRAALVVEDPEEGNAFAASARDWDWMFPLEDPPNYEPSATESIGARALRTCLQPNMHMTICSNRVAARTSTIRWAISTKGNWMRYMTC